MVVTGGDNLAAFRAAEEPVYAQLQQDSSTRSFIERIRALGSESPEPATVTPCAPPGVTTTTAAPSSDASVEFPEGVYRTEMTREQLIAAGIPSATANAGDGVHTLTFQNGQFMHEIKRVPPDQCHGTYTVEFGRVVVRMTDCGGAGRVFFNADWMLEGTTLTLLDLRSETDTDAFVNALWGSRGWERIG